MSASAATVIYEIGLMEAIKRYWNLPIPLPNPFLRSVPLDRTDQRQLFGDLLREAYSPLAKVHVLRLAVGSLEAENPIRRRILALAERLLSSSGEAEAAAYLSILRWVHRAMSVRLGADLLGDQTNLLITWLHAGSLFSMLSSLGVKPDWISQVFTSIYVRTSLDLFNRRGRTWLDVSNPLKLGTIRLLAASFEYVCTGSVDILWPEHVKQLAAERFSIESEQHRFPALPLLKDLSLAPNLLNSFLGIDLGHGLASMLEKEVAGRMNSVALKDHLMTAFKDGKADQDSKWSPIYAVLGDLQPPAELSKSIRDLIDETDFIEIYNRDRSAGNLWFQAACMQVIHTGDKHLVSSLKTTSQNCEYDGLR